MGDGQGQRGSNRKLPKAQHLALAVDEVDELLARVDVGFHVDMANVGLRRVEGDGEVLGDVVDGAAAHEKIEHVALPGREPVALGHRIAAHPVVTWPTLSQRNIARAAIGKSNASPAGSSRLYRIISVAFAAIRRVAAIVSRPTSDGAHSFCRHPLGRRPQC